jgi:uncharacterized protein
LRSDEKDENGMLERTVLRFDHLDGLEHPCFEARGAEDGPRLSLFAGVHGCEYSSIAAVTRFMRELDTSELSGSILAVPVVSLESFRQRSPFVVPADGKNLNRSFPGSAAGTYTDRLARSIFDALIAPADAVIDLHGGDLVEALEPFTIYTGDEAGALAHAFGLPYAIRSSAGALAGMSCAVARVPAILAEAGGAGRLEEHAVRLLVDGTRNALRHLGMLPGAPERRPVQDVDRFEWLYSEPAGFWAASVDVGARVRAGDPLGEVRDLYGDVLQAVHAPVDGAVLFLTTSAAVAAGGLLGAVGGTT